MTEYDKIILSTRMDGNKNNTKGAEGMDTLIRIENGEQLVSARYLHEALESKERFSKWFDRMLSYGFEKNVDFVVCTKKYAANQYGGEKELDDYALKLDMAKEICMIQRSEKGREFRKYFIEVEKAYRDLQFRIGDKKHQLECMELLQSYLPEKLKQEKVSYIKANTVVNKCVSDYFGFPKMLKKAEMNNEMLIVRENVLDDYLKLFEVLQDNGEVKDALYKKYSKKVLAG
jgi:phage anti-repressor protein|nr:MAG TPA: antirepressor protein [Caudoviricetes sp.]